MPEEEINSQTYLIHEVLKIRLKQDQNFQKGPIFQENMMSDGSQNNLQIAKAESKKKLSQLYEARSTTDGFCQRPENFYSFRVR